MNILSHPGCVCVCVIVWEWQRECDRETEAEQAKETQLNEYTAFLNGIKETHKITEKAIYGGWCWFCGIQPQISQCVENTVCYCLPLNKPHKARRVNTIVAVVFSSFSEVLKTLLLCSIHSLIHMHVNIKLSCMFVSPGVSGVFSHAMGWPQL